MRFHDFMIHPPECVSRVVLQHSPVDSVVRSVEMSLDVKLNRVDRVYRPQEQVSGVVVVNSPAAMSFSNITLVVEGTVTLQLSARSVGLFEAFYSSLQPVQLMKYVSFVLFSFQILELSQDCVILIVFCFHFLF